LIYIDPSILFSLYCVDWRTTAAINLMGTTHESLVISPFCELETLNAFGLSLFRKALTPTEAARIRNVFESDLKTNMYRFFPFPPGAFDLAKVLSERITPVVGVRAADLLHIAAALELNATSFYTFDLRQHRAAHIAGLRVNPLPSQP